MIAELTQSIINMTARCGYQTYLRYVKGIIIPPGIAARKGSSTHAGIEHDYRHKMNNGEYAPIDELKDAVNDTFKKLVKEEGVWLNKEEAENKNELLNTALNESLLSAESYHNNIALKDIKIAMCEERLFADIGAGLPLSGKPDVITDGTIPDIKTSGKRWAQGKEDGEIQPVIYRIIARENGLGNLDTEYRILTNMKSSPKIIGEKITWDAENKVCIDIRPGNTTKEYEESVIERVKTVATQIQLGNFPPAFPDTWWCSPSYCGYYSICKYSKGRRTI